MDSPLPKKEGGGENICPRSDFSNKACGLPSGFCFLTNSASLRDSRVDESVCH